MLVGDIVGRHVELELEPRREHLIDINALRRHETEQHLFLTAPHFVLAPLVGCELLVGEFGARCGQLVEGCVLRLVDSATVRAHVVAMHGEAPLLGVLLSVGLGEPAELVVLYACAPNVEPVHILTRTTVPLAAFAERKRDRTLLELALSLKQSVLVAGFCKALQAWQRDIIPVGPARSVDNKLSFRRHNRLRLVVYIIKNAVAGCEQV